jgi:hypothetical protein
MEALPVEVEEGRDQAASPPPVGADARASGDAAAGERGESGLPRRRAPSRPTSRAVQGSVMSTIKSFLFLKQSAMCINFENGIDMYCDEFGAYC